MGRESVPLDIEICLIKMNAVGSPLAGFLSIALRGGRRCSARVVAAKNLLTITVYVLCKLAICINGGFVSAHVRVYDR